jgi:hypothetical protein
MLTNSSQLNFDGAISAVSLSSVQSTTIRTGISIQNEDVKMRIINALQKKGMKI